MPTPKTNIFDAAAMARSEKKTRLQPLGAVGANPLQHSAILTLSLLGSDFLEETEETEETMMFHVFHRNDQGMYCDIL